MNSDNDQEKWDNALLGKASPDTLDPLEKKAQAARQIILWEASKDAPSVITSSEAESFYHRVVHINRQRKMKLIFLRIFLVISFISTFLFVFYRESGVISVEKINSNLSGEIPTMVEIPEGSFMMGCDDSYDGIVGGCLHTEYPSHEVKVEKFALSKYETTVGQFKEFVDETAHITTAEKTGEGCAIKKENSANTWITSSTNNWTNPGFYQDRQHPVVCISWEDAYAYINWLNQKTGKHYRLPTEEEWEYATRAGKATAYYWGSIPDRNHANFLGIEGHDKWEFTSPVGSFTGNNFGLHDMSGNAWEWTSSCWRTTYNHKCTNKNIRVRRGGGWDGNKKNIRSSYRREENKMARSYLYGFRVAHDLE